MANHPQHDDSIHLVKGVFHVNNQKVPILLGRFSVPNILNLVYRPIASHLQSRTDLFILIFVGSLMSRDLQHTISKYLVPGFPDAHRTYTRLIVQCNQSTRYKCLTGGPRWDIIGQPFHKIFNTNIMYFSIIPKF